MFKKQVVHAKSLQNLATYQNEAKELRFYILSRVNLKENLYQLQTTHNYD